MIILLTVSGFLEGKREKVQNVFTDLPDYRPYR
jgi:hypothetical protein